MLSSARFPSFQIIGESATIQDIFNGRINMYIIFPLPRNLTLLAVTFCFRSWFSSMTYDSGVSLLVALHFVLHIMRRYRADPPNDGFFLFLWALRKIFQGIFVLLVRRSVLMTTRKKETLARGWSTLCT